MVLSELKWILAVLVALAVQRMLVGIGAGPATAIRELFETALDGAADGADAGQPRTFEVARSEQEINEQQAHSAELYGKLAPSKPLADLDADGSIPQPDEIRLSMPKPDEASSELKCGEKIPAESLTVTRGVEIFVKSSYRGLHGNSHQWSYRVEFSNTGVDTVQVQPERVLTDARAKRERARFQSHPPAPPRC